MVKLYRNSIVVTKKSYKKVYNQLKVARAQVHRSLIQISTFVAKKRAINKQVNLTGRRIAKFNSLASAVIRA
jgi:hypothetical protein